jgi:hypothetical protein
MPIIFDVEFEDGSTRHVRLPAEIWKKDNESITRMLVTKKPIKTVTLDPRLETADVDLSNNFYPPRIVKSRFELFKGFGRGGGGFGSNPMKRAQEAEAEKAAAKKKKRKAKKSKSGSTSKEDAKKNDATKEEG